MNNMFSNVSADERGYFRINDEIELEYRFIDEKNMSAETKAAMAYGMDDRQLRLSNSLNQIDIENEQLLQKIAKSNPEIHQYLKILSHKIDVVSRVCLSSKEHPLTEVSISAGGLSFHTKERPTENMLAELKFYLLPSYYGIITLARVVKCQHCPEHSVKEPYRVSLEFENLSDQDEQIITRHVFQKQSESIRKAKKVKK